MRAIPHLVGMVHLLPLPGSPRYAGRMSDVVERAVTDAAELIRAGFPALMIENYGDVPFHADSVPSETVASMSLAVQAVLDVTDVPIGVNVLRNDALSAIGIAAANGASFVRVNVLTGLMYTDQGPIEGKAAEVLRKRERIAPDVEVWADVLVKHAVAPFGTTAEQAAVDTVERGLADAVIVSGRGTGIAPDRAELAAIRKMVPNEVRVVVGSGASPENLAGLIKSADTVIVGSSLKADDDPTNRIDTLRAATFVESARDHGLI